MISEWYYPAAYVQNLFKADLDINYLRLLNPINDLPFLSLMLSEHLHSGELLKNKT